MTDPRADTHHWRESLLHHLREHPGESAVLSLAALTVGAQLLANGVASQHDQLSYAMLVDMCSSLPHDYDGLAGLVQSVARLPKTFGGLEYGLAGQMLMIGARQLLRWSDQSPSSLPEPSRRLLTHLAEKSALGLTGLGVGIAAAPMVEPIGHVVALLVVMADQPHLALEMMRVTHQGAVPAALQGALGFFAQHAAHIAQAALTATAQLPLGRRLTGMLDPSPFIEAMTDEYDRIAHATGLYYQDGR